MIVARIFAPVDLLKGLVVVFVLAFILTACSSLQRSRSMAVSGADRGRLYTLDTWTLNGRIAIRTDRDAWQAGLDWQHFIGGERLRLSGPFGQGAVMIALTAESIEIIDDEGRRETSRDIDRALVDRFGFDIPVSALRFWVLGVPEPGVESVQEFDDDGKLQRIIYQGWDVRFLNYMIAGEFVIPKKIQLVHAAVKLKVVVDHWRAGKS